MDTCSNIELDNVTHIHQPPQCDGHCPPSVSWPGSSPPKGGHMRPSVQKQTWPGTKYCESWPTWVTWYQKLLHDLWCATWFLYVWWSLNSCSIANTSRRRPATRESRNPKKTSNLRWSKVRDLPVSIISALQKSPEISMIEHRWWLVNDYLWLMVDD